MMKLPGRREKVDDFRAAHPSFQLEDELAVPGGGERCYVRHGLSAEASRVATCIVNLHLPFEFVM